MTSPVIEIETLTRRFGTFGPGMDYAVILVTTVILVLIGARLYPQLGV